MLSGVLFLTTLAAVPTALQHAPYQQEDEVERLEEWPELEKGRAGDVSKDVQRLRKARTPEMGEQATEALIGIGAAAAPRLLAALGNEKDEEARARIVHVLEAITGAAHTRVLARSFDDKSPAVRTWTLRWAALYPDPGIRAPADDALEHAQRAKKVDRDEIFAAALAATSAGSVLGLDVLLEETPKRWKKDGRSIRTACEGARGAAASEHLVKRLDDERREVVVATLRLLAGCGTKAEAGRRVKPLLDSDDGSIRIGAINALRGIVDGAPPLEKLSVFDSIEKAKAWKGRL